MNNVKSIVAKNISKLRQAKGMTQGELDEKLNYSDKAVSKWERAESMPDITVLVEIADIFEVSLDYLVRSEESLKRFEAKEEKKEATQYNRGFITGVSILLVWLLAFLAFVLISIVSEKMGYQWLVFVYSVPVSMIVWLVFNSIWFSVRRNYLIVSLLMWSLLAAIHLTLLPFGVNVGLIYLLGIPGQIIIIMWSMIKVRPKSKVA
ncbi:MAG: helix-turn-helix transcriptional regulator [Lachnospiraceae bacterium]|nr:helix-turn-helix transcriptional regulator [Lachnospiraceae bacterium]